MSRNHTIRPGTAETHWRGIAAYLAIAGAIAILIGWLFFQGESDFAAILIASAAFVLGFGGLISFVQLFRDAAYLRGVGAPWRPQWWYYVGGPIAATALGYVGADLFVDAIGGVAAVFVFAASSLLSNGLYLYRRHDRVGVP